MARKRSRLRRGITAGKERNARTYDRQIFHYLPILRKSRAFGSSKLHDILELFANAEFEQHSSLIYVIRPANWCRIQLGVSGTVADAEADNIIKFP